MAATTMTSMNLELQNPFAQDFPDTVEASLDSLALVARFNPSGVFAGQYLAVGRIDGCIAILDFETRGVVKFMEGHVKAVTAICWSRRGRYLMTASRDWNVIVWDLESGERRDTIRFDAPVTSAQLHPRNSKILVVTLQSQAEAVFVDLRSEGGRWDLDIYQKFAAGGSGDGEEDETMNDADDDGPGNTKRRREAATVARFTPKGDLVYVGTSQGTLYIFDTRTKMLLHTERISGNNAIKSLEFDRRGTSLVLNSSDRVLRVYTLVPPSPAPNSTHTSPSRNRPPSPERAKDTPTVPTMVLDHKFLDQIARSPWKGCAFSKNGEYVIGGAGHKESHQIFIWDRETGALTKILEGITDPLEDFDWHPVRPVVASVSNLGLIHVWVTATQENWSAYAPGFEELDENEEYAEREDEFDYEDESDVQRRKQDDQANLVDILSIDAPASPTALTAASSSRPPSPSKAFPASSTAPSQTDYDLFAAFEPDDDDRDAFFVPLDYDLEEEEDEHGGPGTGGGKGEKGVVMGVSGLMTDRGERGRGR